MHPALLVPSLLAGDHARLAESAAIVERLQLPWLHVDIMDGHFVPNLTFGPGTLAALRRAGVKLFLDTHLMLDEPHRYVEPFALAGANQISIHIEPKYDHAGTLARIRQLGCRCGIVLNPDTAAASIEPLVAMVDLVLVMTVQPGFGGQAFRRDTLAKLQQIDAWRGQRGLKFRLEVDGGIDLATAAECRRAGADTFVAGTSFFGAKDPAAFAKDFARI
ncbi:MAG: ribulose-phosphate 3-epimerase [Verrucomicrobia bacterium RIFCSPLOWO2_12_FULL_64_8]|nr:MAG: ribulose-phosphate 3-epimerase [Verrucomicrobia bacterium RIFCSPLOWO2_12_FULL_64_8]